MKPDHLNSSAEWDVPFFKVLAKNDTGAGKGHQAGVLIPKALRPYFPTLNGSTSSSNPTIDQRVKAALYDGDRFLSVVDTRYQYQSWHDTRPHEARLTDQLGPIHKIAQAGDVLVMQKSNRDPDHFKLTLVKKTSTGFHALRPIIGRRRWGPLNIGG